MYSFPKYKFNSLFFKVLIKILSKAEEEKTKISKKGKGREEEKKKGRGREK